MEVIWIQPSSSCVVLFFATSMCPNLLYEAGLFSAVSSAFIIQIQPELQADPNAKTQALLGLLVQNMTGAPVPSDLLPDSTGTATIIIAAQSILYFSLFSALLAALLAVLGKQWLLHYDSVGERGTIEERGLERQRKFDGMRHWKFDLVMQIFPLLLQFSLLLFATALSIYLWTIHHGIAGVMLGSTALGFILYAAMIVSAVVSPDSPFQTSLSFLLKLILKRIPFPNSLRRFGEGSWKLIHTPFLNLWSFVSQSWSACTCAMKLMTPVLPLFNDQESRDSVRPEPTPIFDPPPPPSKEISAVLWALETSTDPTMVHSAAAMVPELQWGPIVFDVEPLLKRLADVLQSCFPSHLDFREPTRSSLHNDIQHTLTVLGYQDLLRPGMDGRATDCFMALGILEMVTEQPVRAPFDIWAFELCFVVLAEVSLRHLPCPRFKDTFHGPTMTQWNLRFIAACHPADEYLGRIFWHFPPEKLLKNEPPNKSILADFLFCINSYFVPTVARDRSLGDKRYV